MNAPEEYDEGLLIEKLFCLSSERSSEIAELITSIAIRTLVVSEAIPMIRERLVKENELAYAMLLLGKLETLALDPIANAHASMALAKAFVCNAQLQYPSPEDRGKRQEQISKLPEHMIVALYADRMFGL